jgi:hypothetical protein
MGEFPAPVDVDNDKVRMERLDALQRDAHWAILKKIGSQQLADRVIKRELDSSFRLNPPKLISQNPDNPGTDGYTQEGIYEQPFPTGGEGSIEQPWKTEVVHYGGGCWRIETDFGDSKFVAISNSNREVEVKAMISLSECYYIVSDCKDESFESARARFEFLAGYLSKLDHKGNVSITFSSIPGKSEIHLPV